MDPNTRVAALCQARLLACALNIIQDNGSSPSAKHKLWDSNSICMEERERERFDHNIQCMHYSKMFRFLVNNKGTMLAVLKFADQAVRSNIIAHKLGIFEDIASVSALRNSIEIKRSIIKQLASFPGSTP